MGEFHSNRSASKAEQWSTCHGSPALREQLIADGFVEESSEYADEGTAAHTLAAWCIQGFKKASDFIGTAIEVNGVQYTVDDEMADAVQQYVDAVFEIGDGTRFVEERVSFDSVVPGQSGSCDCITFAGKGVVYVDDYKHGAGVAVHANRNKQLALYGLGALESFDFAFDMQEFVLRIHQPRSRSGATMSEWRLTREELIEFGAQLRADGAKSFAPDAAVVPSDDGCKFCAMEPRCPARIAEMLAVLTGSCSLPDITVADYELLSKEQLAAVMPMFDRVKSVIKKAELYAIAEIESGRGFPGYKTIRTGGKSGWVDEERVIADLRGMGYPDDKFIEPKLLGITKVVAILPKHERNGFKEVHTTKSEGSVELVPLSHPGEALENVGQMLDEF